MSDFRDKKSFFSPDSDCTSIELTWTKTKVLCLASTLREQRLKYLVDNRGLFQQYIDP